MGQRAEAEFILVRLLATDEASPVSLGRELLQLVPKSEARDLFCDLAEVALDRHLDEGVLKDLPVLGTLANLGGAILTIKDRLFLKKVARFLEASRELPRSQVDCFLQALEKEGVQQAVGEKVILLIERQDDFDKAALIGEVFSHYVAGSLTREDFDLLAHSIGSCYLGDIDRLWVYAEKPGYLETALGQSLLGSGLVNMAVHLGKADFAGNVPAQNRYVLSSTGQKLARILKARAARLKGNP